MEIKNVYWHRYYSAHYYFIFDFSLEPPKPKVRLDDTQITVDGRMWASLRVTSETGLVHHAMRSTCETAHGLAFNLLT